MKIHSLIKLAQQDKKYDRTSKKIIGISLGTFQSRVAVMDDEGVVENIAKVNTSVDFQEKNDQLQEKMKDILLHLKMKAESHLGERVNSAVIIYPTECSELWYILTIRRACNMAGMEVKSMFCADYALAITYAYKVDYNKLFLFNLDKNCASVSIVKIEYDTIEFLRKEMYEWIDKAIYRKLQRKLRDKIGKSSDEDKDVCRKFRILAGQIREHFCVVAEEYINSVDIDGKMYKITLSHKGFENIVCKKVDECIAKVKKMFQRFRMSKLFLWDVSSMCMVIGKNGLDPFGLVENKLTNATGIENCKYCNQSDIVLGAAIWGGKLAGNDTVAGLKVITVHGKEL